LTFRVLSAITKDWQKEISFRTCSVAFDRALAADDVGARDRQISSDRSCGAGWSLAAARASPVRNSSTLPSGSARSDRQGAARQGMPAGRVGALDSREHRVQIGGAGHFSVRDDRGTPHRL